MKKLLDPINILQILSDMPARIETATNGLTDQQLAWRPEPEEWSPLEILAHLRACADVWGDQRIGRMLAEDEPTIRAINPKTWIRETDYCDLDFSRSIADFRDQRDRLLVVLRGISRAEWERGAVFTGGGAPRRYTIHTEADALARHEGAHCRQIERRCDLLRLSSA